MKVPYKVSEEYKALFQPPFIIAEVMGVMIIVGGMLAHAVFR
jgi:hypothetical protein